VLSGSVTSSAEPDTRCSGGGNYFINEGVAYRPSPAPAIKCTGDVVLDSSVVSIAANAFWGLSGIRTMVLPANLTTISSYAFNAASSLVSISIPSSVTSIGTNVFSGTISLATFEVSSQNQNFTAFNGALFNKTKTILIAYPAANSQTSFVIPSSVTTIASTAFLGATNLKSIVIPNSVTTIGDSAFSGTTSLTSISIPASVTSIGSSVFDSASSLTSIVVDSANLYYTIIDAGLFNISKTLLLAFPIKSSQLSFTLPNSVTRIESEMFRNAKSLKSIILGSSLGFIGNNAFNGDASLTTISIPRSVTSIGTRAFYATPALTSINVDANNPIYSSSSGVLFDKSKETLIAYPAANSTKNFTIPATVNEIAEVALAGAKLLASVILEPGNSSYVIENGVLLNSERSELLFYSRANIDSTFTVPSSVTEISQDAFLNAFNLNEFKVSSTNITFLSDAGVLFDIDHEILVAYPSGNTSSTYILPATVISVGTNAFASSQFTTLVISDQTEISIFSDSGLLSTVRVLTATQYSAEIKAAADKAAADKLAADKAATDKLAADKAAADKLAADKAAADKAAADAKAAADKLAADKAAADAKAAADKLAADKAAADKAAADKAAADAKAASTKKLITITCVKGKVSKKITALKPVCPSGYKKK